MLVLHVWNTYSCNDNIVASGVYDLLDISLGVISVAFAAAQSSLAFAPG